MHEVAFEATDAMLDIDELNYHRRSNPFSPFSQHIDPVFFSQNAKVFIAENKLGEFKICFIGSPRKMMVIAPNKDAAALFRLAF